MNVSICNNKCSSIRLSGNSKYNSNGSDIFSELHVSRSSKTPDSIGICSCKCLLNIVPLSLTGFPLFIMSRYITRKLMRKWNLYFPKKSRSLSIFTCILLKRSLNTSERKVYIKSIDPDWPLKAHFILMALKTCHYI